MRRARDVRHGPPSHFRDLDASVGVDDADVARRHELAARAEGDAVHRRDYRHRQLAPAPRRILGVVRNAPRAIGEAAPRAACARIAIIAEAGEVEPGAESAALARQDDDAKTRHRLQLRSEEHTSELQSLMRISYA